MSSDHDGEVRVTVTLRGRKATVEDVQQALDTLEAEGIPHTFEVDIHQTEECIHEEGVEYRDQKREHVLTVTAVRAARTGDPS